jgi:iron(III) transport system ATP-binding protein
MSVPVTDHRASGLPGEAALVVRGVYKRFGATEVLRGADLRAEAGSVVALLGASGCGKTTLLRCIAGLERPDAGEIRLGARVLSGGGAEVAAERRGVGMVFQEGALFPHLSVRRNVGYGLPRRERRGGGVAEALALVGLAGFEERMPSTLSGGQQQRVALARALAPRPAAILLDEPFSNLDEPLRVALRDEVRRLLHHLETAAVFVTHDQEEALQVGDEVAVMDGGVVLQQGPPTELYERPRSPEVARFLGDANLVPGIASGDVAETALGPIPLHQPRHGAVEVMVRPERLVVRPGEGALVETVEYYGHDCLYRARLDDGAPLRVRALGAPVLGAGARVAVAFAGAPTVAFPSARAAAQAPEPEPAAATA